MAQFHHVIYFDTATERWYVDSQTDAYFPDGEVYDYAGDQEWGPVPDVEEGAYQNVIRDLGIYLNANPNLEI